MPLHEGDVFADYTVRRLLGSGAMGEVYLAQHPRLARQDAIKILSASLTTDRDFRDRFGREADLAASLWHPHIVGVHDRGEHDGQLWISMDFVDGTDAARLLRDHHPSGLPLDDALDIADAVAEALDFAHQRRMLHRDVKPANILLADPTHGRRRILLSDFGIARQADEISGLTATNMTLGTISYAAPEQLMGEDIDARADQYALAATVYHLLTGAPLFDHSNPAVVISRHLNADPPQLVDTRRELGVLDGVLSQALAKLPDDRFTTCMQFASALRTAAGSVDRDPASADSTAPPQQPPTAASPDPGAPTQVAPVTYRSDDTQVAPSANQPPATDLAAPTAPSPAARRRAIVAAVTAVVVVLGVVAAIALWPNGTQDHANNDPTTGANPPSTASPRIVPPPAPLPPLPPSIQASGTLVVGTNVPYAPAEFKDASGRLAGFDIDLINAVASEMAVRTEFREMDFAAIIPSAADGSIDVGVAAMTDTRQREQVVDMVTYYNGGIMWAQRPGAAIDPNNACGLRIGVQRTTIQETDELPARSQACVEAGKPAITAVSFEYQDQVTNALIGGQVDAMSADSAVTGYAIMISDGRLQRAGQLFDDAPWGWAVAKGSPLATVVQQALMRLMTNGRYEAILRTWGVEVGAVTRSVINGAIN